MSEIDFDRPMQVDPFIAQHEVYFDTDEDGWDHAVCSCDWTSPPCPGKDIAAEFWAEHLGEQ